jgi:hypothetical protein
MSDFLKRSPEELEREIAVRNEAEVEFPGHHTEYPLGAGPVEEGRQFGTAFSTRKRT